MACFKVVPRSSRLLIISSVTGNFSGKCVHLVIISGLHPFRNCLPNQTSFRHWSAAGGIFPITGVTHLRKSSNESHGSKTLKNAPSPKLIRPFLPVLNNDSEAASVNRTSFGRSLGVSTSIKPGRSSE